MLKLRPLLLCCVLYIPTAALAANPSDDHLEPRAEIGAKAGSERSTLTTEMWAPLAQQSGQVIYTDIRLMGDNDDNREGNLGFGYREINDRTDSILGGHIWIDQRRTKYNSNFQQVTLGVESLGKAIDLRANGYIALNGSRTITTPVIGTPGPYLTGSSVFYNTTGSVTETPQYGVDAEIGYRLPILKKQVDSFRVYGGGYSFFRDGTSGVNGLRFRTDAQINSALSLGARVQYDEVRGTQGFLEATIRFPFSAKKLYQQKGLYGRLDESPERDIDIVTSAKVVSGLRQIINPDSGDAQRILYVDNSNNSGIANGTKEHPFTTLAQAQSALRANDILYITAGNGTTSGMNQGITISQNNVQVIGSGSPLIIQGITFLDAGAAPVITNNTPFSDIYSSNGIMVFSDNVLVTGVTVNGAVSSGVAVYSNVAGNVLHNVTIRNVTSTNNDRGILTYAINGGSIENILIEDNHASGNLATNKQGIAISANGAGSHISDAIIRNNTLTNNGNAISVGPSNGGVLGTVTIENNTASNNTGGGIFANNGTGTSSWDSLIIRDNTINSNSGSGISIVLSNLPINTIDIEDTRISGSGSYGISINAQTGTVIDNLTISNVSSNSNTNNGIYLLSQTGSAVNNAVFSDVTASSNSAAGIQLQTFTTGRIYNATLSTNIVASDNNTNGITVSANNSTIDNVTMTGVTASNNRSYGLSLGSSVNGTLSSINVSDVTAKSNTQSGLLFTANNSTIGTANLSHATLDSNSQNGFFVQAAANGTISNVTASNIETSSNAVNGTYLYANTGTISNISLSAVTAGSNTQQGVILQSAGTISNAALTGITANNNLQNGIKFYDSSNTAIMDNTSLSNSTMTGNSVDGILLQKSGATATFNVDLGGGSQNSAGHSRIFSNTGKDIQVTFPTGATPVISAKSNWWGTSSGLQASRYTSTNATIDASSPLTADPGP